MVQAEREVQEGRVVTARSRCLRRNLCVFDVLCIDFDSSPAFVNIYCSLSGWDFQLVDRIGGWIELRRIWPRE